MKGNSIAQEFHVKNLLVFIIPSLIMMVFMSMYTSVDGIFVSRFISEDALGAINIVFPISSIIMALALMLGTGGSAVIGKYLGQNKKQEAREFFSLLYVVAILLGIFIGGSCFIFHETLLIALGCTEELYQYGKDYLLVLLPFAPMAFLQMFAQVFLVANGRPQLAMTVSLLGGVANIILDYFFIVVMEMGIGGAALATGIGYSIPGIYAICHFSIYKKEDLQFVKPVMNKKDLVGACFNGSSELVNNLSIAITTLLFNLVMIAYAGKVGVAAITVILYLQFIQAAVYFGYGQGIAPVISFKYGEQNHTQLSFIIKFSILFITVISVFVVIISFFFHEFAIKLFIDAQSPTYAMTKEGFLIVATSYLFMGLNVFISSMFTALGNGRVSALLSFLRTFLFLVGLLICLPIFFGLQGVWWAVPIAEGATLFFSLYFFIKYKSVYGY